MHSDIEKIKFCLYDSNDEPLDSSFITQGDETLKYDLAPGIYYLAFKEFSGYGTYSFKAGFTDAKETYTYNNNSINMIRNRKAAPLSKKIRCQIALNDTVDYYKFYVPKTGNYSITINSKVDVLFCNLYDSSSNSIESMSHYIGQRTYKFTLKKGTYYLGLNNSIKTGNYSLIFRPTSVSLRNVTAATGSFKAKWKKGTGSGYQLQYSTSSDFSKNSKKKNISKAATTDIKIKNLKKGKRYYVRIRTYVKYNGKKYYSAWSKARSVKTKK